MRIVRAGDSCPFSTEIRKQQREDAVKWAVDVLSDPRAIVLDTETTGLKNPYVVQISMMNVGGQTVFDSIINPRADIEPEAQAVHGISREEASKYPDFYSVWQTVKWVLDRYRIIVYNADYDYGVIQNELKRMRVNWKGCWECAMKWHAQWKNVWDDYHGNYKWHKLQGGDHSALGDCRATIEALRTMAGL